MGKSVRQLIATRATKKPRIETRINLAAKFIIIILRFKINVKN
jgi:hypothetical protein